MCYLEKLSEGVKVKWKKIGDALIRTRGTKITAGTMKELNKEDAPLKIFAGGKTIAFFDFEDIPEKDVNREPSIIVKSRGVIEFEYYDKPFSHKNEMWSYHSKDEKIDIKFVYYFLKIQEPYFQNIAGRMQMPQISTPDTEKFKIPIPPLNIQKEIVRILDTFTEHTAKLTARKQQYSYYREQLLSFDEGEVEYKSLGEVGEVRMCKRIFKNQTTDRGDIPFYKIGTFGKKPNAFISQEIFDDYKSKYNYPKIGEVLISASGTIGRAVIFDGQDAYFQDSNIVWIENDESQVLNKYLFYFYKIAKWHTSEGGTIKRLYNNDLKKTKIPIPSLEEQTRIVLILDKFDTLTNSISHGLPNEIDLRKKQYEYYRDMLLTFPKQESE